MSQERETEAVGDDSVLTEILRSLGPRIKTMQVERSIKGDEKRVVVRIETFGMEDVRTAYIDPSKEDEARRMLERGGFHGTLRPGL